MNHSPDLRLAVTLRLLDGEGQRRFGPGVAALLEEVREKRSLRAAAGSAAGHCRCAGTLWRPCGISFTETQNGCTPSGWGRRR